MIVILIDRLIDLSIGRLSIHPKVQKRQLQSVWQSKYSRSDSGLSPPRSVAVRCFCRRAKTILYTGNEKKKKEINSEELKTGRVKTQKAGVHPAEASKTNSALCLVVGLQHCSRPDS